MLPFSFHKGIDVAGVLGDPIMVSSPEYRIDIEFDNDQIPASGDPDFPIVIRLYDAWGGGKIYHIVER